MLDVSKCEFLKGYHTRLFYRDSCAECRFARPERISDITIGDAWEIEKIYPEFDPLDGVSLLLVNTQQGNEILEELKHKMRLKPVSLQWAVENNDTLKKPTVSHEKRSVFFELYQQRGFSYAVNKATKVSFLQRCWRKLKRIILSYF